MNNEFVMLIHAAEEGGYWAEVPALSGCFVQGESVDEILADAPLAIASHLDALRDANDPVPAPETVVIATVRVPSAA